MVRFTDHISALFRLIRLPNLFIVAATLVIIRICVIKPLLQQINMEPQLSGTLFAMLVIATVFVTAGGYAINDYFDRKIDRVNKPQTLVVGRLIYPRHAMAYHLVFTITGMLLGTWVAYRCNELYLSLVFFMVSGLLWFYSTIYKRELLLGNILVALMTASVPFVVLLFELPLLAKEYGIAISSYTHYLMIWVLGFSVFAFLLNLIREVVKDAEDFEGDRAYGKKTIPVVWGLKTARVVAVSLTGLTIVSLFSAWHWFLRDNNTLLYFVIMLIIPLGIAAVMLLKAGNNKVFHSVSTLLKLIMLAGLGYMIMVPFIIKHLK